MADFIGNRCLKKNNIPEGAFVIFDGGKFYRGCSLAAESGEKEQWIIENGILILKAKKGSPYIEYVTEYSLKINQSPEGGTGKTPNNFGLDIAIPVPDIINVEGLEFYGAHKAYRIEQVWNEKKVYRYRVDSCAETSFKVNISVYVPKGQSATVGQTLLGIRSIWFE